MNKNLYIPLEIYSRELSGMMILSILAANKGWKVYLGGKKVIFPHLDKLPEGIILLKSVVPGELGTQKKLTSFGHRIVSLDAEGLVLSPGESAITLRYSKETIKLSDALFFWGYEQYNRVTTTFPEVKVNGHITGSPVFDYWRYKKFLSEKNNNSNERKKVLIATSFVNPNHIAGEDMAKKLLAGTLGKNAQNHEYMERYSKEGKLQEIIFPEFLKFIEKIISENSDISFILRPHHAENPTSLQKIAQKYPNASFDNKGGISDVMLSCDMLIHSNSTTSIEAAYYGKEVMTFVPKNLLPDDLYSVLNKDVAAVSQECHTIEESLEAISNLKNNIKLNNSHHLEEITEGSKSTTLYHSSEIIVNIIESIKEIDVKRKFPSLFTLLFNPQALKTKLRLYLLWAVGWIDHLTKLWNGKYSAERLTIKYGKTKQGSLDSEKVIEEGQKMIQDFGFDKTNFSITAVKEGLFEVKKIK